MRLFWNLNGDTITNEIGSLAPLTAISLKAGQRQPIELQFHRDRVPELLPIGSSILLGVKLAGELRGGFLTSVSTWTRPASSDGFYVARLSTNTAPIRAALNLDGDAANDIASITAAAELQLLPPGARLPRKAPTIRLTIASCVNQDEAALDSATPPFPNGNEIVRLLPNVTGYTGGGIANLDGVATAGESLDVISLVHSDDGFRTYRLVAGGDAEASPEIIRPDDFDPAANARVWILVTPDEEEESEPGTDEFIRFLPAVSGYLGGGAAKLDGIVTFGGTVELVAFAHATDGLQTYRLVAGADAEASPGIVRPDDFDVATNAFVWQLATSDPGLVIDAPSDGFTYGRADGAWIKVVQAPVPLATHVSSIAGWKVERDTGLNLLPLRLEGTDVFLDDADQAQGEIRVAGGCNAGGLTVLNFDGCTNAKQIFCSGLELTGTLDVRPCPNLLRLDCYHNAFTALKLTGCRYLGWIQASGNLFTELDLTGMRSLAFFFCSGGPWNCPALRTLIGLGDCEYLTQITAVGSQLTAFLLNSAVHKNLLHLDLAGNAIAGTDTLFNTLEAIITARQQPFERQGVGLANLFGGTNASVTDASKTARYRLRSLWRWQAYWNGLLGTGIPR